MFCLEQVCFKAQLIFNLCYYLQAVFFWKYLRQPRLRRYRTFVYAGNRRYAIAKAIKSVLCGTAILVPEVNLMDDDLTKMAQRMDIF